MILFKKRKSAPTDSIVQLTILEGNNDTGDVPGNVFYLKCGTNLIGRESSTCDVVLNSRTISRRHASLHVSADRHQFLIQDLGSANGVEIGGERITPGEKVALASGDEFVVGEIRLKLLLIDEREAAGTLIGGRPARDCP